MFMASGSEENWTNNIQICNDVGQTTVNRERFAGLNSHSFQEYRESFSVNISASPSLY